MLNFVVSNRGAGKTFSTLKFVVNKYREHGEEFVWVRRTLTELDLIRNNMFASLESEGVVLPGEFKTETVQIIRNSENGATPCGGVVPLSKTSQFKSIAWPKVKYIVFDEFIEEKGKYLKNEVANLLSLIETVGRMRPIKVILLANSISKYNPYFSYFNLDFDPAIEFRKDRKRGILIHHWNSEDYTKAKKDTPFAKLLEGTEYASYMFDNANIMDSADFVKKIKVKEKKPLIMLIYKDVKYTCWHARLEDGYVLYFTKGAVNGIDHTLNFDDRLRENTLRLNRSSGFARNLRRTASSGRVYFATGEVKLGLTDLINTLR